MASLNLSRILASTLADDQILVILSSVLFGVLTMLVLASIYALICLGLRRVSVRLLLASTISLYLSSAVYWGTILEFTISTSKLLAHAVNGIDDASTSVPIIGLTEAARACILTATFTVNVCIGDAIVWWRARVLYPGNRKVRHVCCALLSSTFVLGIVSTRRSVLVQSSRPGSIPIVYNGDVFGTAAIALSLATNVFSTTLIGYKAWKHRQFMREHLGAAGSSTLVTLKITALLVESGTIYCLVWVEFLVYHVVGDMVPGIHGGPWNGATFYHEACIAPIVAIYPMVIVVLVAVNKSQLEHGITRGQMSISTWGVASGPHAHDISSHRMTQLSEGGCPFASRITRTGEEEAQVGSSVDTHVPGRSSVDSDRISSLKDHEKPGAVEMVILPTDLERFMS
ncbi:hypothetical protein BD311DRAFT_760143 [Dichomitus squalens]|uniref:Uncharacterized protein n=1 Tax=Dichomitus squalens TaxID=114155 RepID=A0A4Q9MJD2_9APHY|nr:hypothetical protein BD311DRAFT_760143 [Dichomitus squalens]